MTKVHCINDLHSTILRCGYCRLYTVGEILGSKAIRIFFVLRREFSVRATELFGINNLLHLDPIYILRPRQLDITAPSSKYVIA